MKSRTFSENTLLEELICIADGAGKIILRHYERVVSVKLKQDRTPLTEADLQANSFIVDALRTLSPDIPVISEEAAIPAYADRKDWKSFWLVDPLDGTAEFIDKLDEFTVNIALIEYGEPTIGVVLAPAKRLNYFAKKGEGAWRRHDHDEAVRIFSTTPRSKGEFVIAESRRHGKSELDAFIKQNKISVKNRISAGSSLKFCLVAEGKADIYPRLGPTMEWDVAAGDCVYRNSAPSGFRSTTLTYNKIDLRNESFVIGAPEDGFSG